MIRLTWRQFRPQAVVAVAALSIVAIALAITGRRLLHIYDTTVVPCAAQGDCDTASAVLLRNDVLLRSLLGPFLIVVPALIGIFWGAPLVARELETGTFRLAWTQSVSRKRWLLAKLGVLGFASMAVAGLLSLMVTWWFSPVDHLNASRFSPGMFDARGVVPIGYAAFAFAIGVTAGVVLRRTLPAIAVTLVAFLGARLALTYWVRPHLIAPAHRSVSVASSTVRFGFLKGSTGVTFDVGGNVAIPNAWVLSNSLVDAGGQKVSAASITQFVQTNCPTIAAGPRSAAPPDRTAFDNCIAQISANYHLVVTYQPASRYWTFQWCELALYVALALVLAGGCVWWVNRRLA